MSFISPVTGRSIKRGAAAYSKLISQGYKVAGDRLLPGPVADVEAKAIRIHGKPLGLPANTSPQDLSALAKSLDSKKAPEIQYPPSTELTAAEREWAEFLFYGWEWLPTATAMPGYLRGYYVKVPEYHEAAIGLNETLNDARPSAALRLAQTLNEFKGVKWQLGVIVILTMPRPTTEDVYRSGAAQASDLSNQKEVNFYSHQYSELNPLEIKEHLEAAEAELVRKLEEFVQNGSGWQLVRVKVLFLNVARYEPLSGSAYMPLPQYLAAKKAIINVQNTDNECHRWATLSALYPAAKDANRVSKYLPHKDKVNYKGIKFPVTLDGIKKFDNQNKVASNVYFWDKSGGEPDQQGDKHGKLIPIYVSNQKSHIKRINYLLMQDVAEDGKIKSHWCWIKNLSKLAYDITKHKCKKYVCERCLHVCSSEAVLAKHMPDCEGVNGKDCVKTVVPEGGTIKFKNHHKQMPTPYVMYGDFESLLIPIQRDECIRSPEQTWTVKDHRHEACGFSLLTVRYDGESEPPIKYRGPNVMEHFLKAVQSEEKRIRAIYEKDVGPTKTPETQAAFDEADACHICGVDPFDECGSDKVCDECIATGWRTCSLGRIRSCKCTPPEKKLEKVWDHCHLTGKYRGAAHSKCNLKWEISPKRTKIPVFFHNLRGYDGHLILQEIGKVQGAVKMIAQNSERCISFSLGNLQFIDTMQHMPSSLSTLVDNLAKVKDSKELNTTAFQQTLRHSDKDKVQLLLRKGVYPYEYMTDWSRFNETSLPPKEAFYSKLTLEGISDKDYEHAQTVWKTFDMKTMGDYHDLYLRTDMLTLADVFEAHRALCLKTYGLDAANYFTSPGMAWDAALKLTGVELELLTDIDKYNFFETAIRGGISMVSHRHAKANNPQCPDYDSTKPSNFIMYLDANNLYGWAMSKFLPVKGFHWVDDGRVMDAEWVESIAEDAAIGYFLEVDLEYPIELHEAHNEYPMAPEKLKVEKEWMSPYQRGLLAGSAETIKLVPNLMDKVKYKVHYRTLQRYLKYGMRLTKIHRALGFQQSAWLQPYIDLNTSMRKQAKNDFEKEFFKLMNNSVFGKTMENLRNRIEITPIRPQDEKDQRRHLRAVAKPTYRRTYMYNEYLYGIYRSKTVLKLNRPIYCGAAILDLSKMLMYDFYYGELKAQYGDKAKLCYTDTDSLIFQVETPDIYADMRAKPALYDFSDYPKDHPNYDPKNAKVLGLMKDECPGTPISEFVGLRPKMYSIAYGKDKEKNKAKGVKKCVVEKQIRHEQYLATLTSCKSMHHEMTSFRSTNHVIHTITQSKTSLSPLDTKRWIAADGITSLAYGHKDLRPQPKIAEKIDWSYLDELLA